MVKRTKHEEDADSANSAAEQENNDSDSSDRPLKKAKTTEKTTAKAKPKKTTKKAAEKSKSPSEGSSGKGNVGSGILTNTEGEKYVELGKKRRATVRSFKGAALIDIREFYEKDGDEFPGKKGISLSPDQWEDLKRNMRNIDNLIAKLK